MHICLFVCCNQIDLWIKLKLVTKFLTICGRASILKTLDIFSAVVFSTTGMWLKEIQKPLFCANSHTRFAILLQRTECMPSLLQMYANTVLLSVKIWTCLI